MDDAVAKRAGSAADTEEDVTLMSTTSAAVSDVGELEFGSEQDQDLSASIASSAQPRLHGETASETGPPATAAATAETVVDRSLTSAVDGLVLFDLTNKPGGTVCFSPHTIKTILDLKLLNVGYERQRLSFVQIRSELADKVAENVTVPTLELSDGTHIIESWAIAEWLERHHPEGSRLFGGSASTKRLAALLNDFGKSILAPHLGPLAIPGVYNILEPESQAYFTDVKLGPRWAKISAMSAAERESHITLAAAKLGVVEAMLNAETGAAGPVGGLVNDFNGLNVKPKGSVWLAGGDEPTHADVSRRDHQAPDPD